MKDRGGQMLARTQVLLTPPFEAPQPGRAVHAPDADRHAMAEACSTRWLQQAVAPGTTAALAVATQRGTVVCSGEDGTPLRRAVVWLTQHDAALRQRTARFTLLSCRRAG